MSNNIIKARKKELVKFLDSKDITQRLVNIIGDEKKAQKFKGTLFNMALDNSLINCELASIIKSALVIAETNLPISKQLGLAYIVPFGKEAQPIISYKGYKHLLRRDNILIKAREIFDIDNFKMEYNGFDDDFKLVASNERKENEKWVREHLSGIWISVKYIELDEVENYYIQREKLEQLANMSKAKNSKFSPYNSGFWLEMMTAKAVGYVARKIGVSGEYIGKAFEIENNNSNLMNQIESNESDNQNDNIDIFEVELEDLENSKE